MPGLVPDPIVPTPAALFSGLRGRRVIIGVPGIGFRGELRADNPVVQGGRTFVPVLTEQDYYRSELEQIESFATLVPIDRVWVETSQAAMAASTVALDSPQPRPPWRVTEFLRVAGQRIVQGVPDGFVRDLRAISDPYVSDAGTVCLRVCHESEWYAWTFSGAVPTSTEVGVDALWVE